MTTPNAIHRIFATQRADDLRPAAPRPKPRVAPRDFAPILSLAAGLAGLLAIAAPSL